MFKAKCDFGRFGIISIAEGHYEPAGSTDPAYRYLKINGTVNGLCPLSSYSLTFNVFNNVLKKCRKVGPVIGGPTGQVVSLTSSASGDFVVDV